jgi:hypothetical protein
MGLDMYLEVRKFVPAKKYKVVEGDYISEPVSAYTDLIEATKLDKLISDEAVGASVTATAVYWRKTNSIHNWFIQNCANNVDECQPVYVSREKLELLLETVSETIKSKNAELLPPTSGFFFGSTDVDEWYWNDLKFTQRELKSLLKKTESDSVDFIYQASW